MSCRLLAFLLACMSSLSGCSFQSQSPADRAKSAFDLKEYEIAERYCSELLSQTPDHFEALMLRGRCLTMQGRHEAAVDDFSRAAALQPDDPEPLYRRQLSYRRLGKMDLAERDDLAAKAIDPKFGTAFEYDPATFIRPPRLFATPSRGETGSVDEDSGERSEEDPLIAADESRMREESGAEVTTESDGSPERGTALVTDAKHGSEESDLPRGSTELTQIESPRQSLGGTDDDFPDEPLTEPEESPEEAPLPTRPVISTALPAVIPRTDFSVPMTPPMASRLPTTGLQSGRPYSDAPNRLPSASQLPITTGLPTARPSSSWRLSGMYSPEFSLPGARATFPHPGTITTGISGRRSPSGWGTGIPSLNPGAIPRRTPALPSRITGGTALPNSGSRTITSGTALPGSGALPSTGPISTALPGTATPTVTDPPVVSTALPTQSSGDPPRQ